ncbi:MAG TPA: acyl-CoA dehydrogenase family protein [Rhodocyclaceae bacterium]|nr:acyl-CoA dehydrogenase family protein [Rhodocyclaceae bacterium]
MNTPIERLSATPLASALPSFHTRTHTSIRDTVERVAAELAATAVERDRAGGTAWVQRQLLRDSGLLTIAIPHEFGGQGLAWPDVYATIRRLVEADSSLGHLFAFQHLQVASILLYGDTEQRKHLLVQTVEKNWFWGNATNGRDPRLGFRQDDEQFALDGVKSFCSGATGADALVLTAPIASRPGGPIDDRVFIAIPTDRPGVRIETNWDAMGQRQTDSGTTYFDNVRIATEDILGGLGDNFTAKRKTPRQSLRSIVSQLILTEVFIGNALGALNAARDYVTTHARPWQGSGVDSVADDRYIQKHYGELWVALQGSIALTEKAAHALQAAWDRGDALTAEARGEVAVAVFTAKASATRSTLEITSRVFETMGAGAVFSHFGHDRFWRNVRTHTLHDPIDYKLRDLGRWLLTGHVPEPGVYS